MTRRGPADWMLAAEALVLLAGFRLALACVPVRRIIAAVARGRADEVPATPGTNDTRMIARRVQWAVGAAARHSPVEFVCFPQALAGYTMLRWRGVESTLVYGVARSPQGELVAHTWLLAGEQMVLGGDAAREFTGIERWT
ncbi:MAG TPA: lasso peptide biosynthesis B2 protein [Acidobacteriaceae bacterium]|nr:lasso peptide biosynthesis B2 protein [Acidobacteriaceae bacterium]